MTIRTSSAIKKKKLFSHTFHTRIPFNKREGVFHLHVTHTVRPINTNVFFIDRFAKLSKALKPSIAQILYIRVSAKTKTCECNIKVHASTFVATVQGKPFPVPLNVYASTMPVYRIFNRSF